MDKKNEFVQLLGRDFKIEIVKVPLVSFIAVANNAADGIFESEEEIQKIENKREKIKNLCIKKLNLLIEQKKKASYQVNAKIIKDRENELKKLMISIERPTQDVKPAKPIKIEKKSWFSKLFN